MSFTCPRLSIGEDGCLKALDGVIDLFNDRLKNFLLWCILGKNILELEDLKFGCLSLHTNKLDGCGVARFAPFMNYSFSFSKNGRTRSIITTGQSFLFLLANFETAFASAYSSLVWGFDFLIWGFASAICSSSTITGFWSTSITFSFLLPNNLLRKFFFFTGPALIGTTASAFLPRGSALLARV